MFVAAKAGPLIAATAPTGLTVSEGDHDGTLDLHNDRVKGVRSYVYEMSLDPPTATSWKHAAASPKVFGDDQRARKRDALLVQGSSYYRVRTKRLERPGNQDRALMRTRNLSLSV